MGLISKIDPFKIHLRYHIPTVYYVQFEVLVQYLAAGGRINDLSTQHLSFNIPITYTLFFFKPGTEISRNTVPGRVPTVLSTMTWDTSESV